MDLGWISMDLDWIFYGFHGSGVDFPWNPPTSLQVGVLDLVWIGVFLSLMKLPLMDFHGMGWIWGGFSMEFMDFGWISMDPDWIFYGFHGSGMDFPWNSWISAGFSWIRTGFSTDFFNLGWIFHGILGFRIDFYGSGLDFLRIPWIWGGFSMEFIDFGYGFPGCRMAFH